MNTLTAELAETTKELQSARSDLASLKKNHDWNTYVCYLLGKIERQRKAIRTIQKVGWQPTIIIREMPYPDDAHLWINEPLPERHHRQRRVKRHVADLSPLQPA